MSCLDVDQLETISGVTSQQAAQELETSLRNHEDAPRMALSWLKVPSTSTYKILLKRHYAKWEKLFS